MSRVPVHLQKFIRAKEVPDGKVWRAHWAIRPETGFKKEYLSMVWAMEMANALPAFGAKARHSSKVSQRHLAAMQGVRRETVNRRIAVISSPSGCKSETREKLSELARCRAQAQGKMLRNGQKRSLRYVGEFLHRSRGWGESLMYTQVNAGDRPVHTKGKGSMGDKTAHAKILADAFGENNFDPTVHANGYKVIDGLLWHPDLPDPQDCDCVNGQLTLNNQECPKCGGSGTVFRDSLPDFGRVLASHLILKGIKEENRDQGKAKNCLEVTQQRLADELGMDVNTIAKYERKLEALMIIRIVPGDVHRDASGSITKRDPHKILWILDKLLDEQIADREATRYATACRQAQQKGHDEAAIGRATAIFRDLLRSWIGREHSLQAFYNEMRRRLASAGVPSELAGCLFPLAKE